VKFQICETSKGGLMKVLATVEAPTHPQAAARYWKLPDDAVERTSGWGGQNGSFMALERTMGPIYVKRAALK